MTIPPAMLPAVAAFIAIQAPAQPSQPSSEPAPAAVLERLQTAYAGPGVAESVGVQLVRDDGTFSLGGYRIETAVIDGEPVFELAVETFRFVAAPTVLLGERNDDGGARTVLAVPTPSGGRAASLGAAIPLGPMPQLWGPGPDGVVTDRSLGRIEFDSVSTEGTLLNLAGRSAGGGVLLTLDADTGRLVSFEAEMRDGTIELRASPVTPDGVRPIVPGSRRVVTRVDQLAAAGPVLRPGDVLPDLNLLRPDGQSLALTDWLETASDERVRPAWRVLAFVLDDTSGEAVAHASRALERLREAAETRIADAEPVAAFWLRYTGRTIVVVEPTDGVGEANLRPELVVDPKRVAVSGSPADTIDRLPGSGGVVLVAIDADRVIGSVRAAVGEDWTGSVLDDLTAPARRAD